MHSSTPAHHRNGQALFDQRHNVRDISRRGLVIDIGFAAFEHQPSVAPALDAEDRLDRHTQHFPGELNASDQRVPEVLQLSPEQFAALSQPVMLSNPNYVNPSASQINTAAKSSGINATLASARLTRPEVNSEFESHPAEASVIEPPSDSNPSLFKGFMKRFGGSK